MERKPMKEYKDLKFSDDFMFGKVMEDKELCREVLECLLGREVGELSEIQSQREFRYTSDGKPMRLDVYNKDEDDVIYDAEMENLNQLTVRKHELPKRSRFYQGAIYIDHLNRGDMYYELPDSNIMFICTFDPFGYGIAKYTFREWCEEADGLLLEDWAVRVFYNSTYEGEDISDELRAFYEYLRTGQTGSELTKKIDAAVDKGRRNEIWRTQYMKELVIVQEARLEGREEGREEGRAEGIAESIIAMISRGKTPEEIADFCGYPLKMILEVKAGMKKA